MKVTKTKAVDVVESSDELVSTADLPQENESHSAVGKSASIQDAVDRVVMAYSMAQGYDMSQFAEDYTHRPSATMEDVFGSADLEYEQHTDTITSTKVKTVDARSAKQRTADAAAIQQQSALLANQIEAAKAGAGQAGAEIYNAGVNLPQVSLGKTRNAVTGAVRSAVQVWQTMVGIAGYGQSRYKKMVIKTSRQYNYWKKSKGREGFFSRALAAVDDVFILVPPTTRRVLELSRGSEVLKKLDTRKEKRQVILEYIEEISRNLTTGEP